MVTVLPFREVHRTRLIGLQTPPGSHLVRLPLLSIWQYFDHENRLSG